MLFCAINVIYICNCVTYCEFLIIFSKYLILCIFVCLLGKNNNFMQFEAPNKYMDVNFGFWKSEKLCHCRGGSKTFVIFFLRFYHGKCGNCKNYKFLSY